MIDSARLSAFIASRICHDLVSPVSSVTNALDLMEDPGDPEMKEQAQLLLVDGARKAAARLQFLRYAFGSIGLNSGAADIHEVRNITENFVRSHKPSIEWDIQTDHLSFSHARLIMNLVMLGVDSLPRGGVISVRVRNEPAGLTVALNCKGDRAKLKKELTNAIQGEEPEDNWRPENIQCLFSKMVCDDLGGDLSANQNEQGVIIMAAGLRPEG